MQMRFGGDWALIATCAVVAGCPDSELAPLQPCTVSAVAREVQTVSVDQVDLLFVVDNSGSMEQEQIALARELPRMVEILASGDSDGDGDEDFPPVKDLHLGVVSTDLGAPEQELPDFYYCDDVGDDGLLRTEVADLPECADVMVDGSFLSFSAGQNPQQLGQTFSCITQLGIEGCGQEQQLDAMLKALVPSTFTDVTFYGGSLGHGDTANAGFLRRNAVLAVILVTDEDDCSIPQQNIAQLVGSADDEDMGVFGGFGGPAVNLRCGENPDLLHPLERYRDALRRLKDNPELVIFAAIAGVPVELQGQRPETILADPSMQFRPGPGGPLANPVPSCEFPDPSGGEPQQAYPPRRIVELAGMFGANGTVQSICQNSFQGALDNIIEKISAQLKGGCLPRPLTRTGGNVVACDVIEEVYDPGNLGDALCEASRGRTPVGRVMAEAPGGVLLPYQLCRINQVGLDRNLGGCEVDPGSCLVPLDGTTGPAVGWYYDDFSQMTRDTCAPEEQQRVTFTPGAAPAKGANVRFECLQPVFGFGPAPSGREAVGLPCENDRGACAAASTDDFTLTCEPQTNTCQISCEGESSALCPNGWVCSSGLCINPTCPAIGG